MHLKKYTVFIALFTLFVSSESSAQRITVTPAGNGISGVSAAGMAGYLTNVSSPHDVCLDGSGNIYYTDQGMGLVRMIAAGTGLVSTIAGGGSSTSDGITATSALISPRYMCMSATGNLYITTGNKVRMINLATGIISTVAGTGAGGYSGDGGAATAATMNGLGGVCIDGSGNIFVVDSGNNCVRKINTAGNISTYAGTGAGSYTGDGGPATAATLHWPTVICVNAAGDVYVADQLYLYTTSSQGMFVRKISASTGIITTVAGTNTFLGDNLFGLPSLSTYLGHITGMCCDGTGSVYCHEISCSCRRIDMTTDSVYAEAGNFEIESYGDGINSLLAYMNNPYGICVDASGNLYAADEYNNRVRKMIKLTHNPTFAYGRGQYIYPCTGTVQPFNVQAAMVVLDSAQTETWTVLTAPVHGSLSGFPFTMLSKGTDSLTTPSGLSYTPSGTYMGLDSFVISVSNGSMSDVMTIYVSVVASSPMSVLTAASVCTGASTPLIATAAGGTWSVTNSNTYIYSGNIIGYNNGLDTMIYSASGVCSATGVITVNVSPSAGLVTGISTLCVGSVATLTDGISGGVWSTSSPTITIDSLTGVVTGVSNGTASVLYTVSNGICTSNSPTTMNVGIPTGEITGTTSRICTGATTTYWETLSGGTWSISNGDASYTSTGTTAYVAGMVPGMDTLTYSFTNVCGTNSITNVITVNPIPAAGSVSGTASVCVGSIADITATVAGGTWSSVFSLVSLDSSTGSTGVFTGAAAGVDTVVYTVTVAGCSAKAKTVITVDALPSPGVLTGTASIYVDSVMTVSPTVSSGVWSSDNTAIATVSGTGVVTGVAPGVDTIVYTVTNSLGCSASTEYIVTIHPDIPTSVVTNTKVSGGMRIAPNPAHGTVTITVDLAVEGPVAIDIYNTVGQLVGSVNGVANQQIQTSINLAPGVYQLRSIANGSVYTGRLVVE